MFRKKDAFEKWLNKRLDQTKEAVRVETKLSQDQGPGDMEHTVMRIVHENGRDILDTVLRVYEKFKKGEDIKNE